MMRRFYFMILSSPAFCKSAAARQIVIVGSPPLIRTRRVSITLPTQIMNGSTLSQPIFSPAKVVWWNGSPSIFFSIDSLPPKSTLAFFMTGMVEPILSSSTDDKIGHSKCLETRQRALAHSPSHRMTVRSPTSLRATQCRLRCITTILRVATLVKFGCPHLLDNYQDATKLKIKNLSSQNVCTTVRSTV